MCPEIPHPEIREKTTCGRLLTSTYEVLTALDAQVTVTPNDEDSHLWLPVDVITVSTRHGGCSSNIWQTIMPRTDDLITERQQLRTLAQCDQSQSTYNRSVICFYGIFTDTKHITHIDFHRVFAMRRSVSTGFTERKKRHTIYNTDQWTTTNGLICTPNQIT